MADLSTTTAVLHQHGVLLVGDSSVQSPKQQSQGELKQDLDSKSLPATPPSIKQSKSVAITKTVDLPIMSQLRRPHISDQILVVDRETYGQDSPSHVHEHTAAAETLLFSKALPQLPGSSGTGFYGSVTTDPDDAAPSPTIRKFEEARTRSGSSRTKRPQFRQSRRWAKVYNTAPADVAESETRAPTLRETSFEQQRAQFRSTPSPDQDVVQQGIHIEADDESIANGRGFCRPVSMPCWQSLKAVRLPRPTSLPTKWVSKRHSVHRQSPMKAREVQIRQSLDKAAMPRKFRGKRRIRSKRGVDDLRKRAGVSEKTEPNNAEGIVNLDAVNQLSPPGNGVTSPVPTLHDPEKVKRFSQECEALLENLDFGKDWLLPPGQGLPLLEPPSGGGQSHVAPHTGFDKNQTGEKFLHKRAEQRALHEVSSSAVQQQLVPNITVSTCETPGESTIQPKSGPRRPEPPIRTSSKGRTRLPTIVSVIEPTSTPILNVVKNDSLVAERATEEASSTTNHDHRFRWGRKPIRMPSTTSTTSQGVRTPNPANSTDTLSRIEAQVQANAKQAIVEKLREKTAFIVLGTSSAGPSGIPPERPLPALPAEDDDNDYVAEERQISTVPHQGREPQDIAPRTASLGRTQQIAASKRLSLALPAITTAVAMPSPDVLTPRSVSSQDSTRSRRQFSRHDISNARGSRIGNIKSKIQKDLAVERQRRISEENEPQTDQFEEPSPLPPLSQPLNHQPSVDLDHFPPVPASRPQSRASVTTGHSQNQKHSHARTGSRSSLSYSKQSNLHRSYPRQVLGQSNIVVLVDTNPHTGLFRAGAISPPPSMGGGSRSGSPAKMKLEIVKPTSLQEIAVNQANNFGGRAPKVKRSIRSLRSQQNSPRRPSTSASVGKRSVKRKSLSVNGSLTSSDEAPGPVVPQKRRRWNSTDIQRIQQNLEDYSHTIKRQERRIREQDKEIRMMVRVLIPISRAHGLRLNMPASLSTCTSDSENRSVAHDVHGRSNLVASLSLSSNASRGPSAGRENKNGSPTIPDQRPVSSRSSTSSTTQVSNESGMPHPSAASMTDPFDYDLPSLRPASGSYHGRSDSNSKSKTKAASTVATGRLFTRAGSTTSSKTQAAASTAGSSLSVHHNRQNHHRHQSKPKPSNTTLAATMIPLHSPPPVARDIPRSGLSEEEEDLEDVHEQGRQWEEQDRLDEEPEEDEDEDNDYDTSNRLSVNHQLTSTTQMDQAIYG